MLQRSSFHNNETKFFETNVLNWQGYETFETLHLNVGDQRKSTIVNITVWDGNSVLYFLDSTIKYEDHMFAVSLQLNEAIYTDLQDQMTLKQVNTKMWKRNAPLELYFTRAVWVMSMGLIEQSLPSLIIYMR